MQFTGKSSEANGTAARFTGPGKSCQCRPSKFRRSGYCPLNSVLHLFKLLLSKLCSKRIIDEKSLLMCLVYLQIIIVSWISMKLL